MSSMLVYILIVYMHTYTPYNTSLVYKVRLYICNNIVYMSV